MVTLKCQSCGAEMEVSQNGDIYCPYCNASLSESHEDYKLFRYLCHSLLVNLANGKDTAELEEKMWKYADTASFESEDGKEISIKYIYSSVNDGVEMYVARNNILFLFEKGKENMADIALKALGSIKLEDTEASRNIIPGLGGHFYLKDGRVMLAYFRPKNMYPLGMFGNLPVQHVEWVYSTALSFVVNVLNSASVAHRSLDCPDSWFIDIKNKNVGLYGGWWTFDPICEKDLSKDFINLRSLALKLVKKDDENKTKEFIDYLKTEPSISGNDEWSRWVQVAKNLQNNV